MYANLYNIYWIREEKYKYLNNYRTDMGSNYIVTLARNIGSVGVGDGIDGGVYIYLDSISIRTENEIIVIKLKIGDTFPIEKIFNYIEHRGRYLNLEKTGLLKNYSFLK